MEWTEETPLNPTNLNNLEDRIATADANVIAGKAAVAVAITAMGQAATGDETYVQLAGHIADISDDANAAVGDILDTKTFYQGGSKKTGTMVNKVGSATVITPSTADQTFPQGYYGGAAGDGKVSGDADLVSANIKAGANIFNVAGNANVIDTSTGDATAAQILAGKKAGVDGTMLTGTMPDRAGDTAAISSHNSGTSIHIVPAAGFYDGGDDAAVITDADNVVANIKKDVDLFGLVGTFTTEATAPIAAATVLTGKKGWVNGALVTGTMPDRAGDTAALAQTRSGTTIKLRASEGYRDGTNDYVTHADANDVAENIKAGVTIRELLGTYVTPFTAGDYRVYEAIYEQYSSADVYSKRWDILVHFAGTYRIKFKLKPLYSPDTAYGRIYKNGSAFGTERINDDYTTWIMYTEDLFFAAGESIQLYTKGPSHGRGDFGIYTAESYELIWDDI